MSKINIDANKLNSIINQAFDAAVEVQGDAFQDAIADDIWDWPRKTHRRNSDIVMSPRDAVDTGELYDSLVISRNANAAEYLWDCDHAAIVHDGATTKNGTDLPARPWTEVGLENCDAADVMQREIDRRL